MENKQYSLKVFETRIEDDDKFMIFFDKNYLLFKDHLIHIKGEISQNIKNYLEHKEINYLNNISLPQGRTRKALESEISTVTMNPEEKNEFEALKKAHIEKEIDYHILEQKFKSTVASLSKQLANHFTVLDTMIRSGRELNIEGDLLLLNRVNSGATIHTTGNLIITQVVEGALRCDGAFMMITVSPKANIIFNGVIVDNVLLTDKLNRIELKNNEIYITPVIQKEINWAS